MIRSVFAAALVLAPFLASTVAAGAQTFSDNDRLLKPGQFAVGPYSPRCGDIPTLLAEDLPVGGAALTAPGDRGMVRLIVINPKNLRRTTVETRMFVYTHECGHHVFGPSEVVADCYASMRGRREGWLTEKRLDRTCRNRYIGHRSSERYPPGTLRCRIQRYCFANATSARALSEANVRRVARAALDRVLPIAENYLRAEREQRR